MQIGNSPNFNGPPIIASTSTPEPIVERAINAIISQVVSTTALAGVTYTLDVDLGFGLDMRPDDASVYLIVGTTMSKLAMPLPSYGKTQAQMQGTGNWYDFQTSYTATSADAGDPISIVLSSITGNTTPTAYFADVRLVDSLSSVKPLATPEPTDFGDDAARPPAEWLGLPLFAAGRNGELQSASWPDVEELGIARLKPRAPLWTIAGFPVGFSDEPRFCRAEGVARQPYDLLNSSIVLRYSSLGGAGFVIGWREVFGVRNPTRSCFKRPPSLATVSPLCQLELAFAEGEPQWPKTVR